MNGKYEKLNNYIYSYLTLLSSVLRMESNGMGAWAAVLQGILSTCT